MDRRLASLLFYNETLYVNPVRRAEVHAQTLRTDKHVLVLSKKLKAEESAFLDKVLKAVKLSLNNVALHEESIELAELVAIENVKYILSFGKLINKNTLTINMYESATLDGKTFLFADQVAVVAKNENSEKTKLWNALKKIFFS